MSTIITGADGFIGSNYVRSLKKSDDVILHCGNATSVDYYRANGFSRVTSGDLSLGYAENGLPDCNIETLIHLAGLPHGNNSTLEKANVDALKNVAIWALQCSVKKIIFASTAALYGDTCEVPADEESLIKPQSDYAISKLKAETHLKKIIGNKASILSFRMPHIYGVGKEIGVLASIIANANSHGAITLNGDGYELRDFIHISDVVRAIELATSKDFAKEFHIFNIGSGLSVSLRDLCKIVSEVLQKNIIISLNGEPAGKPHCIQLNIEKAKDIIGWEPKILLSEGITQMLFGQI